MKGQRVHLTADNEARLPDDQKACRKIYRRIIIDAVRDAAKRGSREADDALDFLGGWRLPVYAYFAGWNATVIRRNLDQLIKYGIPEVQGTEEI